MVRKEYYGEFADELKDYEDNIIFEIRFGDGKARRWIFAEDYINRDIHFLDIIGRIKSFYTNISSRLKENYYSGIYESFEEVCIKAYKRRLFQEILENHETIIYNVIVVLAAGAELDADNIIKSWGGEFSELEKIILDKLKVKS